MAETEGIVPQSETKNTTEGVITPELIARTAQVLSNGRGVIGELDEVPGLVMARRMLDEKGRDSLMKSTIEDLREGRTRS